MYKRLSVSLIMLLGAWHISLHPSVQQRSFGPLRRAPQESRRDNPLVPPANSRMIDIGTDPRMNDQIISHFFRREIMAGNIARSSGAVQPHSIEWRTIYAAASGTTYYALFNEENYPTVYWTTYHNRQRRCAVSSKTFENPREAKNFIAQEINPAACDLGCCLVS